jgi:WD40 repeat protein
MPHPFCWRSGLLLSAGLLFLAGCGSPGGSKEVKEPRTFEGHKGDVLLVALSADSQRAVSLGADQTLRVWNVLSGKEERSIEVLPGSTRLALARDGKRALTNFWTRSTSGSTTTDEYRLIVWDLDSGKEVCRSEKVPDLVDSLALSPDGLRALSGGTTHTYLWEVSSGKLLHTFGDMQNHTYAVAFAPDGGRAVAVSGSNV